MYVQKSSSPVVTVIEFVLFVILTIVGALFMAAWTGCAYEPPTFGEQGVPNASPPPAQLGQDAAVTAPTPSESPSQDAGSDAAVDSGLDASQDATADATIDAAIDAAVDAAVDSGHDCGSDAAVDAGNDSGLAADGSGLFRLVVSPGGGAHNFTVYFHTLTGRPGEPTWGNPVYSQNATTVFDQSVKAFPGSTFITQGYWDPASAGDWTRQMCNPNTLTLAVTVNAAFQGSYVPITVISNGQGGCNLQLTMPLVH